MKKLALASLLLIGTLASAAASASDGTITVNGAVTATTCTINGGTANFAVTLPKVSVAALQPASVNQQRAGETAFTIALTNCSGGGNVRANFEAGPNVNAWGNLKNLGTATNVVVELWSYNNSTPAGTRISIGSANQGGFTPIVSNAATLRYSAIYASFGTGATAGSVTTSVTYSLEYQ